MSRLVFVATERLPHRTGNGVSVLQHGLVECFRALGYAITIVPLSIQYAKREHEQEHRAALRAEGMEVIDLPGSRRTSSLLSPVRKARRLFGRTREDLIPFSEEASRRLNQIVRERNAELVLGFGWASVALTASVCGALRVASIVDLISSINAIRQEERGARSVARKLYDFVGDREWAAAHVEGLRQLRRFDMVLEHAYHHTKELEADGFRHVHYLPHPMTISSPLGFEPKDPAMIRVLMPGSLKGMASIKGFEFLLDELLPRIRARSAEIAHPFKIRVVGHGQLPQRLHAALLATPELDFGGYVDDMDTELRAASIVLVTIPVTLGFRTRLAEACGHGMCCVVHSANSAGMPELVDGKNVLSSDAPDALASRLIAAINDGARRRELGTSARTTFETEYSVASAIPRLRQWLEEAKAERLPVSA